MSQALRADAATSCDLLDFSAFRTAVSDAVVPLDLRCRRPQDFRGRLDAAAAGDIVVFGIEAAEHAVHRTPRLITRAPSQYVKFTLVGRGSGLLVQGGRETTLRPGDMAVYDTDHPYSLLFDDTTRFTVVMFPKALLPLPAEPFSRVTAVRLDGSSGVGGMVGQFVSSMGTQVAAMDGHIARRMYRTAVDMIGTLLMAAVPEAPHVHDVLVTRIHDFIEDNLSDSELDPARIARAQHISLRHLHALFSEQGITVSTLIRQRRLERCYDELVDPLNAHRSVGAIALGHGFVDPAHFSRTFRAHYGVSPSSVRG